MNTRLLMELRVEVGVAQGIGAVPGGTRRTCRWPAGPLRADTFAVLSCPAVARTGYSFGRTAYSNSTSGPHSEPTTAR